MLGKEANEYYYKNEERAFQDSYVGGEKELIMWARIYSEDVLHRSFEPISDFMVLDKIEQARDTKDIELFYRLSSGFALLEYMAADKGFGSSRGSTGRTEPNNLYEQLAMEAAKADPLSGRILRINMTDSRWLAEEGWIKMSQRINGIEVHYVYNKELGLFDDFKFR